MIDSEIKFQLKIFIKLTLTFLAVHSVQLILQNTKKLLMIKPPIHLFSKIIFQVQLVYMIGHLLQMMLHATIKLLLLMINQLQEPKFQSTIHLVN